MRYEHHVQAWVRDRVKVLSLLEQLHAIECKTCALEMARAKRVIVERACGR